VLNCRISPTACSSRRVVERRRHGIELVAGAADRYPPPQLGDVDRPGRVRQLGQRPQRHTRHPSADHERDDQAGRYGHHEQHEESLQRGVDRRERDTDLQQIGLARGGSQHAVGEADPAVIGIEVERHRPLAELPDLLRRELEPERPQRIGLHQQVAGAGVEDLVVARRLFDERGLRRIGLVEDGGRHIAGEAYITVEAAGELDQVGRRVGVELIGEHPVGDRADQHQQRAEERGVEQGEPRAQRERHGGSSASM
jgi:hypothetical protein